MKGLGPSMTTATLPRFARKEIREFAAWMIDHDWVYTGDDAKGHALFTYPRTGASYSLPETPRHFPIQKNRAAVVRLMGQEPAGKRRAKEYKPAKKATAQEALTHQQLDRLCEVVSGKFGEFVRGTYRDGKPTASSHALDRMRRDLIAAIREHA